jgi:hypothetical protein
VFKIFLPKKCEFTVSIRHSGGETVILWETKWCREKIGHSLQFTGSNPLRGSIATASDGKEEQDTGCGGSNEPCVLCRVMEVGLPAL